MITNAEIQKKRELCNQIINYGEQYNSFKEFNQKILDKLQVKNNEVNFDSRKKEQIDELVF